MVALTYGTLKQRVLKLIEAEQDADAQGMVADWVDLGLDDVFDRLRAWWMVRGAKIEVDVDSKFGIPPSYISMLSVAPFGGGVPLTPVTSEQSHSYWDRTGDASHYLQEGEWIWIVPPQAAAKSYRVSYYSKLTPLVGDNDTNELLRRAPSIPMFAAAVHASLYRGDDMAAQRFSTYVLDKIETVNQERFSDAEGNGYVMTRV